MNKVWRDRRVIVVFFGLAMLGLMGGLMYLSRQSTPAAPVCPERGAIDAPLRIDGAAWEPRVQGWHLGGAAGTRIEVVAGGRVVAAGGRDQARPDVQAAYPGCGGDVRPGFSVGLHVGRIPPATTSLEVRAVAGDGRPPYVIGTVPVALVRPLVQVDAPEPIRWNGRNLLQGWVVSPGAPAEVEVLAAGRSVVRLPADRARGDVAEAFPAWPAAARAGFETVLSLRQLPRGRYPLRLRVRVGNAVAAEVDGPDVINDAPIGKVFSTGERLTGSARTALRAWLADEDGIVAATVEREDTGEVLGRLSRRAASVPLAAFPDPLAKSKRMDESPLARGDVYAGELTLPDLGDAAVRLRLRVRDGKGGEALLPGPLVASAPPVQAACTGEPLRIFMPGDPTVFRKGFHQFESLRAMAQGGCVQVGIRARVEYLRTTRGRAKDFEFDPDFPAHLRDRPGRQMTGDSLRHLLALADRFQAPLLVTLDGGVWADSKFADPEWDVVDFLEQDDRTAQWNQHGKAEPDDALSHLPGSVESPQLARMMSLNRFNSRFLAYKKRNLQAAAREIAAYIRRHPGRYVAVSLDPDQYINPWFYLTQWYDYNPDTLRQYREWLFHLGPYADGGAWAASRSGRRLTLAEANTLARAAWKHLDEVEPPRGAIDYADPWQQLWTRFKRHLVARHYDDLAAWVVEAGVPAERVFTGQTFIQTDVAVTVDDPASGWTDQAGVSIQGAKPAQGHIGAILYGPASRDEGKPRAGLGLLDNIRRTDPAWGVPEFHPANISYPERVPDHAEAYATLERLINGGARFLSPMWGSKALDQQVHPSSFRAYDALDGTPFEYQLVWWARQRGRWPWGSLSFPFGNALVRSADGWRAAPGVKLTPEPGIVRLHGSGRLELHSPALYWRALSGQGRLSVTGRWPAGVVARARLELEDGSTRDLALEGVPEGARGRFQLPAGQPVRALFLEWNGVTDGNVTLDAVTLE